MAKLKFAERDLLTGWLVSTGLSIYMPYICSPTSQLLCATQPLTYHEDNLNWYHWEWPSIDDDELSGPLLRILKSTRLSHPLSRFRFIDVITGTVSVETREHEIRELAHDVCEDIEQQIAVARKFDGWAVCFKSDEFPPNLEAFIEDVGFETDQRFFSTPDGQQPRKGGRPSLQNVARRSYHSAYPDGHGDTPWKIVVEEVSSLANRRISAKTIQRALVQEGS